MLRVVSQDSHYVDTDKYGGKTAFGIATVDQRGIELPSATIFGNDSAAAKVIAIALATNISQDIIAKVTDSQAACRDYATGSIAPVALRILQSIPNPPYLYNLSTLGPKYLEGNKAVHAAARAPIYRALPSNTPASPREEYLNNGGDRASW